MLGLQAAGLGFQFHAAKQQQKAAQTEGEMQARAIEDEQKRKQIELVENQRRTAANQSKFNSSQIASIASSGAQAGSGSPLTLIAESYRNQQLQLADSQYQGDTEQRGMSWEASRSRYGGAAGAYAAKQQKYSNLISGVGQLAASAYSVQKNTPRARYGNS
jgi:hypothetical protein